MLVFGFARYLSHVMFAFVCNSNICLVSANVVDGSFLIVRRCHYSGESAHLSSGFFFETVALLLCVGIFIPKNAIHILLSTLPLWPLSTLPSLTRNTGWTLHIDIVACVDTTLTSQPDLTLHIDIAA